jgi:zinc transport system substrate-binding protein
MKTRPLPLAMPAVLAAALTALALVSAGCSRSSPAKAPSRLLVFTSIPPLQDFVQRVGGERVQAEALVQPGQEPHTYEPTPQQMAGLARARLFFLSGFPFENALVPRLQSTMPDLEIVDTREGIVLRDMGQQEGEEEEGQDPHVWMSPLLARRQAQTIRDALVRADPAGERSYRANFERFASELQEVHQELSKALAPLAGRELLVYHPAFGYFAAEYGLKQVAVQMGGKEPTARQLAELIRLARERHIRVVFVQPQFSQAGARAVAEAIGGAAVPLDDLPRDYLANLRDMSRKVQKALATP